jgi:glutathione S-transferase
MITLYGNGPSRWVRPYWTLQELGIPFETKRVSVMKGENRAPEFLAINPFGKLPALVDGDLTLFESAAICTYLADKHAEKGLIPTVGTRERAIYDQWVSFAISELEQPLWRITRHKYGYPEPKRSQTDIELAKEDFHSTARTFEPLVKEHLVGDRFTVADIMVTYVLKWAEMFGLMGEHAGLRAYMEKHAARPAFPKELYG